jgi:hypothetical protein
LQIFQDKHDAKKLKMLYGKNKQANKQNMLEEVLKYKRINEGERALNQQPATARNVKEPYLVFHP